MRHQRKSVALWWALLALALAAAWMRSVARGAPARASAGQLMLRAPFVPAVVLPPATNIHTDCFAFSAPGAAGYVLGWTWDPSEFATVRGPAWQTNVAGTNVCISYPATNPVPYVAVASVDSNFIQGPWSTIITLTNFGLVDGLSAPTPGGQWQPMPEVHFTRTLTNASEFYRLKIFKYSNWPYPPGFP